jgi:hypothetical protein
MQHLSGNWADVLAWVTILAGLVACAGLIVRLGEPRQPAPCVALTDTVVDAPEAEGSRRLGPEREWALVVRLATQGLDRSSTLATLHADAARKIAAAEHAFDRLVADYASLCGPSAASAAALQNGLATTPRKALRTPPRSSAEHRSLAA